MRSRRRPRRQVGEDLSLVKFVGGHGDRTDYVGLRSLQLEKGAGCPHIVSIRNRSFASKCVSLSEVVTAVLAHKPGISTFLVNCCRGESDSRWTRIKAAVLSEG